MNSRSLKYLNGQRLELPIEAQDANADALTYSASGLPEGAELSDRQILWTPSMNIVSAEDAQAEFVVDLWVSDGALKAVLPIQELCKWQKMQTKPEENGILID